MPGKVLTSDDRLKALVTAMSDIEITAVCDYRAAIRRACRRMERVLTQLAGVGRPVAERPCLADTVGSAFEYYWRSRDVLASRQIESVQDVTKPAASLQPEDLAPCYTLLRIPASSGTRVAEGRAWRQGSSGAR